MSLKNLINTPFEIDGEQYRFDENARIKINQFYRLDLLERQRMLLLAEKIDEKLAEIGRNNGTFATFMKTSGERLGKIENAIKIKENGDIDFTVSGKILLNGNELNAGGGGDVTLAGNNSFTGTNSFNNINLRGQISYSNNPLFVFKYLNFNNQLQSTFHLGNVNFPLNLIAKDSRVLINGKELAKGGESEIVFSGEIAIDMPFNNQASDAGSVVEYDYGRFVEGKEYSMIYFKFEDNLPASFNFLRFWSPERYCFFVLCPRNESFIYHHNSNPTDGSGRFAFFIKIDDKAKKIYVSYSLGLSIRSLFIKNISIF